MYNFFVNTEDIYHDMVKIKGSDYNHIKNVLRMKSGTHILINDRTQNVSYLAKISKINEKDIDCKIIESVKSNEMPINVTLFQGIPKSDKMEYIIQKSVELGVKEIVPVEMKNCVAKINNEENKIKRWNTISETAAKQSKRSVVPKVENKISYEQLINRLNDYDLTIVAYENEKNTSMKEVLQSNKNAKNIAVIIGPEGGIDFKEFETLKNNGVLSVSLGKRILRTETAPITIMSMLLYEFEM